MPRFQADGVTFSNAPSFKIFKPTPATVVDGLQKVADY